MVQRPSYGTRDFRAHGGGLIATVEPGSPAADAGLVSGDIVCAAEGRIVRDVIDWQWIADGPSVRLTVVGCGTDVQRDVTLERQYPEAWGFDFAAPVFDDVHTCTNNCVFCFVHQLPPNLRPALYVRDDDYRLSFLQGNFITLTNLTDVDVARIGEQRLSPLYVSLHAVDPAVRSALIRAREDNALDRFDELLSIGVELHVQIVLVPAVNDEERLDETLSWLAERSGVLSVGIVPLGYTRHQTRFSASYEGNAARAVIEGVARWRETRGDPARIGWVYCADEFYLAAGLDLPPATAYGDFPQYENGIGLARTFLDGMADLAPELREALARVPSTVRAKLVTGELAGPLLEDALRDLGIGDSHAGPEIIVVENRFFGGNVTVAGLLASSDLVPAIASGPASDVYLVPDVVANTDGLLLDGTPVARLGTSSNRNVRLISCDAAGLLEAFDSLAGGPLRTPRE